jgi:hypothetical protein
MYAPTSLHNVLFIKRPFPPRLISFSSFLNNENFQKTREKERERGREGERERRERRESLRRLSVGYFASWPIISINLDELIQLASQSRSPRDREDSSLRVPSNRAIEQSSIRAPFKTRERRP